MLHTTFGSPGRKWSRPVCRLGLASRGGGGLTEDDVLLALAEGVNFLNWCGSADGLSRAVAGLGSRRQDVIVCVQLEARTAAAARPEFEQMLELLGTNYVDILTFYYVEEWAEWEEIISPGGALEFCREAQASTRIRSLGLTSHQRPLAARAAKSSLLDMLMIRYNAAHRGAETDVFPVTDALGLPVVVYTCLRWGALLEKTPDDPPGFIPPRSPAWYRFALESPSVTVALMAPANRSELLENLEVLRDRRIMDGAEFHMLAEHGRRVRKHAGSFP